MKNQYRLATILLGLSLLFSTGCISSSDQWLPSPQAHTTPGNGLMNDYHYQQDPYYPAQPNTGYAGIANIRGKVVIVDPGHGGKDPGASGHGVREKDINLIIATKLARLLQEAGGRVIMTRTNDVFIELDDRAAAAENYNADILVSVHADSISRSSVSGATVLTGARASQYSKRAAWMIDAELKKAGIKCRANRSQSLRVCDGHSKPAVLVETGFLTNRQEARNLDSDWYQNKIATAIAKGVARYLNSNK